MLLLLLAFVPAVTASLGWNPTALGCQRANGDYNYQSFFRPLMIGDEITFNGTVMWSAPPGVGTRQEIDILAANGDIVIHIRQDMPNPTVIYDNWIAAQNLWVRQEFGGQLFALGQPFQIKLRYTGSTFEIFSGNAYAYSFVLRTPSTYQLVSSRSLGMQVINWTELNCIDAPVTDAPETTTRDRGDGGNWNGGGGHGGGGHHHHHGNGHGHGHKGGYDSDSSSSSSGSSELCDD